MQDLTPPGVLGIGTRAGRYHLVPTHGTDANGVPIGAALDQQLASHDAALADLGTRLDSHDAALSDHASRLDLLEPGE